MVKKHMLLHPLIPINKETFFTSTEIYHHSVVEAYTYCRERNFVHLWGYLWINWYNRVDWNLFARASFPSAIPLARTTMLVESHWRVLKYNYKYNCNRPRLDRLTQILTKELIPDQISTWERFNNNREFPSWWGAFKSEWKKALDGDIESDDRYLTNVDTWICSCPAFIKNTYMVCKHLVKTYTDGIQHFLNIQQRTEDMTIHLSGLVRPVQKLVLPTGPGLRQVKVCSMKRRVQWCWMKTIA